MTTIDYQSAVAYVAAESFDRLRYHTWPALDVISHIYGVDSVTVNADFRDKVTQIETARKKDRIARNREANQQRHQRNQQSRDNRA